MDVVSKLVRDFYGSDPIAGEDAYLELIKSKGVNAIDVLVPLDREPFNSYSTQIEARCKALAETIGDQVVPHLVRVISDGPWRSKIAAAACFAGLKRTKRLEAPLIKILEAHDNIDAQRLAIEALGFLGAYDWAPELEEFAMCGRWAAQDNDLLGSFKRSSKYHFEKLSSYVLEANAQFVAKCSDQDSRDYLFRKLTHFIELRQSHLPNHAPDSYELVERHCSKFTEWTLDPVMSLWGTHSDEQMQYLCMAVLLRVASVRSAKFLLETAISPLVSTSIRTSASIALGEIRHPRAAERLANALRNSAIDKSCLNWAFSTLYAVQTDWSGLSDYLDSFLEADSEPAIQLRYSLALRGDIRCKAKLVDCLDDNIPYKRWTAALALARLLGSESRVYLDQRAEEAGDALERCAMYAAVIHAGDKSKTAALHEALQEATYLPTLRTIWKVEILDALRTVGTFDTRAFSLWRIASQMGPRQLQYFDVLLPDAAPKMVSSNTSLTLIQITSKTKVFVSYSRKDSDWLARFQLMMRPLIRTEQVELWDDTKIQPGKWRTQIEYAMSEIHVALFLVSANFFASEFIINHELPDLLRYAEERNVTILWVLLDECLWEETPLAAYQGENYARALSVLSEGEQNSAIKQTCLRIRGILQPSKSDSNQ